MAKIVRSLRLSEEVDALVDKYLLLMKNEFGKERTFSSIASIAIAQYLSDYADTMEEAMKNKSVVERRKDGSLKVLKFTEEQIEKMSEFHKEAFATWYKLYEDLG